MLAFREITSPTGQRGILVSSSDPLLKWREEFPILANTNYLISNSLGAMPRAAAEGMQEYAESWATRGVRAWAESWWELPVNFGDRIALLIGGAPGSISMHLNVTLIEAVILSCFDFSGEKTDIVYTDMNFPSVHYLYSRMKPANAGSDSPRPIPMKTTASTRKNSAKRWRRCGNRVAPVAAVPAAARCSNGLTRIRTAS